MAFHLFFFQVANISVLYRSCMSGGNRVFSEESYGKRKKLMADERHNQQAGEQGPESQAKVSSQIAPDLKQAEREGATASTGSLNSRRKEGEKASWVGIASNFFLAVSKTLLGALSGSVAILADGLNNLTDIGTATIGLLGFRLSSKPADVEHPYGHARLEYLFSSIISFLILVTAGGLAYSSVQKILQGSSPQPVRWFSLAILGLSISLKFYLWQFFKAKARKLQSSLLKAMSADALSDVWATLGVAGAVLLSPVIGRDLDGFFGLLVSILIGKTGVLVLKKATDQIVGESPDQRLMDGIEGMLAQESWIMDFHDLRLYDYGPGAIFGTVDVEVEEEESLRTLHEKAEEVKQTLYEAYGVSVSIHLEPFGMGSHGAQRIAHLVEDCALAVCPGLEVHDLRIKRWTESPNLIMDLSVPLEERRTIPEVEKALTKQLRRYFPKVDPCYHSQRNLLESKNS